MCMPSTWTVYVCRIHTHTCTYLHTYTHMHIPLITLQSVWVEYVVSCKEAGVRAAQYSTFTALWRQLTPQIQVMKPMSDLCWVCQQNSRAIMKAANMPEEQKSQVSHCKNWTQYICLHSLCTQCSSRPSKRLKHTSCSLPRNSRTIAPSAKSLRGWFTRHSPRTTSSCHLHHTPLYHHCKMISQCIFHLTWPSR